MNGILENKFQQLLDFKKVILIINTELKAKGIYDCEYMLINNSIDDIIHILENESDCYTLIKDDKYDKEITFMGLLENYFLSVKEYYNNILIKEGNTDRIADKYHSKLVEPTKRNNEFIIYDRDNIEMSTSEIQRTLMLMKEAAQAYYKVYNNKKLIAELTTNNIDKSEYFDFCIKEEQLLHLLGVTINQLRINPDFQRLTGNKNMNSIQILEWILTDIDGNKDLLQYNDDFLKKLEKIGIYSIIDKQKDSSTQLINYYKVRSKSQTFLKFGPFENVSLVAKLGKNNFGEQKTLSKNSNSTVAMISRAETFKKYPWAYFGLVNDSNNQYIESLQIDSSENKKDLFQYSKPAIIKGIYANSTESGGTQQKLFSEEEQFELFIKAYDDFSDKMDFTNLIEYFVDLKNKYVYDSSNKFKR